MLVSGSKRGTRMPEDTSRERRCCGLDSFLEVKTMMIKKKKVLIKMNGFGTDLVSRNMSCRHLSAPKPVVRTRCSPTHTT